MKWNYNQVKKMLRDMLIEKAKAKHNGNSNQGTILDLQ